MGGKYPEECLEKEKCKNGLESIGGKSSGKGMAGRVQQKEKGRMRMGRDRGT
jgi:hypothetical protein